MPVQEGDVPSPDRSPPARKSASDVGELTAEIRRRSGLLGGFGRVRVCRIGLRPFTLRDACSAPGLWASSGFRRRSRFGPGCPLPFPACLDLVPDHRQRGFGYRRSRLLRHHVKSVQKACATGLVPRGRRVEAGACFAMRVLRIPCCSRWRLHRCRRNTVSGAPTKGISTKSASVSGTGRLSAMSRRSPLRAPHPPPPTLNVHRWSCRRMGQVLERRSCKSRPEF